MTALRSTALLVSVVVVPAASFGLPSPVAATDAGVDKQTRAHERAYEYLREANGWVALLMARAGDADGAFARRQKRTAVLLQERIETARAVLNELRIKTQGETADPAELERAITAVKEVHYQSAARFKERRRELEERAKTDLETVTDQWKAIRARAGGVLQVETLRRLERLREKLLKDLEELQRALPAEEWAGAKIEFERDLRRWDQVYRDAMKQIEEAAT